MTRLLGQTPKKDGGHETYTAAESPSILAQQKWLAAEEVGASEEDLDTPVPPETPSQPSPAPAGSIIDRQQQMVDQLQHHVAERDATVASLLMENLIVLRTFKAELEASESGMSHLETRVSTLEAVSACRLPAHRRIVRESGGAQPSAPRSRLPEGAEGVTRAAPWGTRRRHAPASAATDPARAPTARARHEHGTRTARTPRCRTRSHPCAPRWQSEAETTQMMGATFQKDAQQRLELKHSKAREKEKEHEIELLKAELQAARAETDKARARIKEVSGGERWRRATPARALPRRCATACGESSMPRGA